MTREPIEDPDHEFNSAKYHTGKECIEAGCTKPAGTAWSPHWCQACNCERMQRITQQLNEMTGTIEMRQVTIDEAQAAGEKSKRAAIRSCLKHWRYNHSKTIAELEKEPVNALVSGLCALCHRYQNCVGTCKRRGRKVGIVYVCPLKRFAMTQEQECAGAYYRAHSAYYRGDEQHWKLYSLELVELLEGLLK